MTSQPHPYRPEPSTPINRPTASRSDGDSFTNGDALTRPAGDSADVPTNLPVSWMPISQADGEA